MEEQIKFKEGLDALLDLAAASDGTLTMAQIREACGDFHLSGEQLNLVCAYLESNRVKIQDSPVSGKSRKLSGEPEEETVGKTDGKAAGQEKAQAGGQEKAKDGDGRESAYYKMYLDELKKLRRYRREEEEELIEAMLAGDAQAKERLIEGNLPQVVRISKEYLGQGVLAADLVQEGNMALLLAMETYDRQKSFRLHLLEEIERAMVEAIREQTGADDVGRHLAQDANALMRATEELAEELEREATAQELAAYLHMDQAKVEALVKMSLDAMNMFEG